LESSSFFISTRIDLWIFTWHWRPSETHMTALTLKCKPLPKSPFKNLIWRSVDSRKWGKCVIGKCEKRIQFTEIS
jgi:hypothetical protein